MGLVAMVALMEGDTSRDLTWMGAKIAHLRVFPGESGRMDHSVLDIAGQVLLVPNFTVAGRCRRGRRPSFDEAMAPERARQWFERLAEAIRGEGVRVATGVFGASMSVRLANDGPITLILDSRAGRGGTPDE